jgi:hypothetical protein
LAAIYTLSPKPASRFASHFPHFIGKKGLFVNYLLFAFLCSFTFTVTFRFEWPSKCKTSHNMRSRIIIRFVIVALALAGTFLVLKAPASSDKNSSSNESLETTCQKQKSDRKMMWENLSHQFFSSF